MKELGFENIISYGKFFIGFLGAGFGTVSTYLYGDGSDVAIKLFLLIIALDWISGIGASKKDGTYSSAYGLQGIIRTIFILILPGAAYHIDLLLNLPGTVFYFVITGLAFHIVNSIAANVIRAGWSKWIPKKMLDRVTTFVQSEIESKEKRSEKRNNNNK